VSRLSQKDMLRDRPVALSEKLRPHWEAVPDSSTHHLFIAIIFSWEKQTSWTILKLSASNCPSVPVYVSDDHVPEESWTMQDDQSQSFLDFTASED